MSNLEYFIIITNKIKSMGLEPSEFKAGSDKYADQWGYYLAIGLTPFEALQIEYPDIEWDNNI